MGKTYFVLRSTSQDGQPNTIFMKYRQATILLVKYLFILKLGSVDPNCILCTRYRDYNER